MWDIFVVTDKLHTPGGSRTRSSRGHSPQYQSSSSSEKNWSPSNEPRPNLPAAPPTLSPAPPNPPKVDATQIQGSQVDSWEDIDDTGPSPQPPTVVPDSSSLQPGNPAPSASELKTDCVSNSSSGRSTPKSQEHPLVVKEAPSSSSASSSSTPDLAKIERKQPSPSLLDKGTAGVGRGDSGGMRGNKHSQVAPPKDEHEKENINIVFIGHVGKWCLVYRRQYECPCFYSVCPQIPIVYILELASTDLQVYFL